MGIKSLIFTLLLGSLCAAELPRKSPEFVIKLSESKQLLLSENRGKVVCLVFILTT